MILQWTLDAPDMPWNMPGLLQLAADCCMAAEGIKQTMCAGITLTDDGAIQNINRNFRGIDASTDVLSFPSVNYKRGHTAGNSEKQLIKEYDSDLGACFLGDVVISIDHVKSQALEYGHSKEREAAYLMVHGICHLMGYDHETAQEKAAMRMMEEKALGMMGLNRMEKRESVSDEMLLQLAREAMERSYAPYSKFKVGACVLSADGRVFQGCNVENASFGLTNCAERTALFTAVTEGVREFSAIAIAAQGTPPWPCGACRQVLNEFAPDIRVMVTWDNSHFAKARLNELLPHGFGPKELDEGKN